MKVNRQGLLLNNIGLRFMRSEADGGNIFTVVPKEKQLEALDFFDKQLFQTPFWLLDKKKLSKINVPTGPDVAEDMQVRVINTLLDKDFLLKLQATQTQYGNEALSLPEFFNTLHGYIWNSLGGSKKIQLDSYQRNMQKAYLGSLTDYMILKDGQYTETDAATMVKAELFKLQKQIDEAISRGADDMTTYHLLDMQNRIKTALSAKAPGA